MSSLGTDSIDSRLMSTPSLPRISTDFTKKKDSGLMSAWKVHDCKGISSLKLAENIPLPPIKKAKDVLAC